MLVLCYSHFRLWLNHYYIINFWFLNSNLFIYLNFFSLSVFFNLCESIDKF